MEGTARIPEGGIFPHNLIGNVMRHFTEQGWPYPEEVCRFWDESVGLAQALGKSDSQYDAEAELLGALGLWKSSYIPSLWHDELAERERSAQEAKLKAEMAKLKLQAEAATILRQPDPPRFAKLFVKHVDDLGEVTTYPVAYGPILLKEDGNWKYHETATIRSTELTGLIHDLMDINNRIKGDNRTLAARPYGTPTTAGKSSPSTA